MTIQDLKNLASEYLQAADATQPQRLRERVMVAHTVSVTNKLQAILDNTATDDVLTDLENLLKDNWQDTQRTMLCYTAMPESDITRLLIKTAEFIAQSRQERPVSVFELLMPGVCTESIHDAYPDLHTGDVHTLLSRHVLGGGSYLIPVKLLTGLNADERTQLRNVYFDYEKHETCQATINEAELERLYQHSPETRALKAAYDTYQTHLEDKSTLLDNLLHLCAKLHLSSSNMQGAEDNAGSGAYPAIIEFNDYYASLADSEKADIPQKVSDEIKKLLALSSDKEQNTNATDNLETCIATRRSKILEAIKGQETTLRNIAVSDAHKNNLTIAAKEHIAQCLHELKTGIEQDSYRGNDSFGLTRGLLERLKIHLSVSSLADLHEFLSLPPEEITELGQSEELKFQIAGQVKTLEEWVILATETPLHKLEALMALIGGRLANAFVKKSDDVNALLMTLTPERIDVVCDAIKNKLPDIIQNDRDLVWALRPLSPEQRASVYTAIADNLPDMIKNGWNLAWVLQDLSPEQRTSVYTAIEDKLPDMIKSSWDLAWVLKDLSPEQCASVCSAINDKMPDMIKNRWSFRLALYSLEPEQRTSIYTAMENQLFDFIKNSIDLALFLDNANPEVQKRFFASAGADTLLANIITNFKRDIPIYNQRISSDDVKNTFNQALFSGLLQELEAYIKKIPDHDKQRQKAEDGLRLLKNTSDDYFNAYPNNEDKLDTFQQDCRCHINSIKSNLRDTQGLATILGKILLAVGSLGLIPLGSAIKNKYQTGDFKCRFFEAPGVREADAASRYIEYCPRPIQ